MRHLSLKMIYLAAVVAAPLMAQQFSGAIHTTSGTGVIVNQNTFGTKPEVHLTGGPQNLNSAGLPNGYYYFQVTVANGVLLSPDPLICRQVQVIGGKILRSYDGANYDGAGCSHALGTANAANGNVPVQLIPFNDTTNAGGVYKLWLFSQDPAIGCGTTGPASDGFGIIAAGGCSKTDNFKVTTGCPAPCGTPPASTISGLKYNDLNGNGVYDPATDPPLANWQIDVTGTKLGVAFSTSAFTASDGTWSVPDLDEGTQVRACEVLVTNWVQTGPVLTTDVSGIIAVAGGPAPYGPRCWQGTIPVGDVSNLNFGNYAQLLVSKTATPSFTRTYNWTITKTVDKTRVTTFNNTATFTYAVTATQTGFRDSAWAVSGVITVLNPNALQVSGVAVTDSINNSGTCTVTNGANATIPAATTSGPGAATFAYTCTYTSAPAPAFINTATATWFPGGSPVGTASGTFGAPATLVNKTINVTDTFNLITTPLGTVTASDTTPYTFFVFTYVRQVTVPATGCVTYSNTAAITQTGQIAGPLSVEVCRLAAAGAKTKGFWQNKNGQGIITGGAAASAVCNSGTWLRQFAPFRDLSATATCLQVATYVTNVIKEADAAGTSMNPMLKAQDLATSLDVYFSDPALGGNQIAAPVAIGGVYIDLTKICKNIGSCTIYEDVRSAFGVIAPQTSLTVLQMLTYAASQSNVGGSIWYAQVKATQELAKDAFDAINNEVAILGAP